LDELIRDHSAKVSHEQNISAARMIELISQSHIAIAPASTVAMEICCVKAGLLTGIVDDNQQQIHRQLVDDGCAVSIGNFNDIGIDDLVVHIENLRERDIINKLMTNQKLAIDGLSGERIANEFNKLVC